MFQEHRKRIFLNSAVYFRQMIMNGGDFYTGRALSKKYKKPFCGVF